MIGTIRFIVIVAIFILALSFFGISIRSIVQSPAGQDNFTFIWELVKTGWHVFSGWFSVLVGIIQQVLPKGST